MYFFRVQNSNIALVVHDLSYNTGCKLVRGPQQIGLPVWRNCFRIQLGKVY